MARKYYLQVSSGEKWGISEVDYNNIHARIQTGRTNGWYIQRGPAVDASRNDWAVAFKDVASVWADGPERKDKVIRDDVIDVNKRKPQPVGKPEPKKTPACSHDWNDPTTWNHVTTIVNGNNRYFKQCALGCGQRSPLVKKREVELAQEAKGETIDTVPLVE